MAFRTRFTMMAVDGLAMASGRRARLRQARVPVHVHPGVAHEFFGMGAVVADARTAVQQAGTALRGAFGR